MPTFGETLRQARLDKGVSLEEASEHTRIRRRYLESLEAEDVAGLPAPVYARGFVRTYAEYLGLNPQAMVDLYQPAPKREREVSTTLRPALQRISLPRQIPVRPMLYVLGAVAAIGVVIYLVIQLQSAARELREQEGILPARAGTMTLPPRVPTPNPIVFASPSPTVSPTPTVAPTPTPVIDGILVQLRATDRVYVEAAVDRQPVLAETLSAGAERTLPLGRELVVVRVSNGSAVQITLNGKPQDSPTSTGAVELEWRR